MNKFRFFLGAGIILSLLLPILAVHASDGADMIDTYLYAKLNALMLLFESVSIVPEITPEALTVFGLLICFCLLLWLEIKFPKYQWPINKLVRSVYTNFNLFLFNNIVLSLLSMSTLIVMTDDYLNPGLLQHIPNSVWYPVLSFLLLDLFAYLWHVACHKLDFLWMYHKVHHSDQYLNVSTTFRLHVIEIIIFAMVKLCFIISLGIDKATALVIEAVTTLFIMFHHTNICFSSEKLVGRLFVVPALHQVHHSIERKEHDRNYGAVLSIWDRLFGTLTELEPAAIGIKTESPPDFWGQLKFGFTPDHSPSIPTNPEPARPGQGNIQSMIAEAAYYKAQQRAFSPGNELVDWLEAEAEISRSVCT